MILNMPAVKLKLAPAVRIEPVAMKVWLHSRCPKGAGRRRIEVRLNHHRHLPSGPVEKKQHRVIRIFEKFLGQSCFFNFDWPLKN